MTEMLHVSHAMQGGIPNAVESELNLFHLVFIIISERFLQIF